MGKPKEKKEQNRKIHKIITTKKKHRKNKIENTWQAKDTGTHQRKDNNRYKLAICRQFGHHTGT